MEGYSSRGARGVEGGSARGARGGNGCNGSEQTGRGREEMRRAIIPRGGNLVCSYALGHGTG